MPHSNRARGRAERGYMNSTMIRTALIFTVLCISLFFATPAMAGAEARCKVCHAFTDKNNIGPGLKGVFGRKAGTHPGFAYGSSMKKGGWTWDEAHLREWIYNAPEAIKKFTGNPDAKTKMPKYKFKGEKADRIINFLKELK